jgi:hypothetical protein
MVTFAAAAGTEVVIAKVALVWPAGTDSAAGTVAALTLLLASATANPPAGAGPFRVTVPVGFAAPPITVVGLAETALTVGGFTVSVAVTEEPL